MSKGVPQGSILGPLLFLIFINDMHYCCPKFANIMFADDTTLTNPLCTFSSDQHDTETSINLEINKVYYWLSLNKLSLNSNKSKFMIFHYPQKKLQPRDIPHIQINGFSIERVTEFDFLGLTLDESLSWKNHINKISNKIASIIGIINKQKNFLPQNILKLIYDSFILPHLNYCIAAWGYNMGRIIKLQKRAIRVISKVKYNAHTDPLFKKLSILKAEDLFHLNCLKIFHNYQNSKVPHYIKGLFVTRSHDHNTRQIGLAIPRTLTSGSSKRIKCSLPKLFNTLPNIITDKLFTHSLDGFSNYFKNYKLTRYKSICNEVNCYVCGRGNTAGT